jgi:hypothetical protein
LIEHNGGVHLKELRRTRMSRTTTFSCLGILRLEGKLFAR